MSRNATINGLNQLFKIMTDSKGKSYVEAAANAEEVISNIHVADRVVRPFDVDNICERIIAVTMQGSRILNLCWEEAL